MNIYPCLTAAEAQLRCVSAQHGEKTLCDGAIGREGDGLLVPSSACLNRDIPCKVIVSGGAHFSSRKREILTYKLVVNLLRP